MPWGQCGLFDRLGELAFDLIEQPANFSPSFAQQLGFGRCIRAYFPDHGHHARILHYTADIGEHLANIAVWVCHMGTKRRQLLQVHMQLYLPSMLALMALSDNRLP